MERGPWESGKAGTMSGRCDGADFHKDKQQQPSQEKVLVAGTCGLPQRISPYSVLVILVLVILYTGAGVR